MVLREVLGAWGWVACPIAGSGAVWRRLFVTVGSPAQPCWMADGAHRRAAAGHVAPSSATGRATRRCADQRSRRRARASARWRRLRATRTAGQRANSFHSARLHARRQIGMALVSASKAMRQVNQRDNCSGRGNAGWPAPDGLNATMDRRPLLQLARHRREIDGASRQRTALPPPRRQRVWDGAGRELLRRGGPRPSNPSCRCRTSRRGAAPRRACSTWRLPDQPRRACPTMRFHGTSRGRSRRRTAIQTHLRGDVPRLRPLQAGQRQHGQSAGDACSAGGAAHPASTAPATTWWRAWAATSSPCLRRPRARGARRHAGRAAAARARRAAADRRHRDHHQRQHRHHLQHLRLHAAGECCATPTSRCTAPRRPARRAALFDAGLHEQVSERVHLEGELRRAIEHGQLSVTYQPLFNLGSGRLHRLRGAGALAAPDAGPDQPGHLHPDRRGVGADRAADRLRARRRLPPAQALAGARRDFRRPQHAGQRCRATTSPGNRASAVTLGY